VLDACVSECALVPCVLGCPVDGAAPRGVRSDSDRTGLGGHTTCEGCRGAFWGAVDVGLAVARALIRGVGHGASCAAGQAADLVVDRESCIRRAPGLLGVGRVGAVVVTGVASDRQADEAD